MPGTWPAFTDYLAEICATELTVTPDTTALAPQLLHPDTWIPRTLPDFALRTLLHDRTRALLDIPRHPTDRPATAAYARAVKSGMRVLTPRARLVASARV